MIKVTFRRAELSDSEFVYQVRKASFREYVEQIGGWNEDDQRTIHAKRFASLEFLIVQESGVDVGIFATAVYEGYVQLHQVFILPEHQGKGIGRISVEKAQEEGRRRDLPVRLRVLKVNERAETWYRRLGFRYLEETEMHYVMQWSPLKFFG